MVDDSSIELMIQVPNVRKRQRLRSLGPFIAFLITELSSSWCWVHCLRQATSYAQQKRPPLPQVTRRSSLFRRLPFRDDPSTLLRFSPVSLRHAGYSKSNDIICFDSRVKVRRKYYEVYARFGTRKKLDHRQQCSFMMLSSTDNENNEIGDDSKEVEFMTTASTNDEFSEIIGFESTADELVQIETDNAAESPFASLEILNEALYHRAHPDDVEFISSNKFKLPYGIEKMYHNKAQHPPYSLSTYGIYHENTMDRQQSISEASKKRSIVLGTGAIEKISIPTLNEINRALFNKLHKEDNKNIQTIDEHLGYRLGLHPFKDVAYHVSDMIEEIRNEDVDTEHVSVLTESSTYNETSMSETHSVDNDTAQNRNTTSRHQEKSNPFLSLMSFGSLMTFPDRSGKAMGTPPAKVVMNNNLEPTPIFTVNSRTTQELKNIHNKSDDTNISLVTRSNKTSGSNNSSNLLYYFPVATNGSDQALWKLGNDGFEAAVNMISTLPFPAIILASGNNMNATTSNSSSNNDTSRNSNYYTVDLMNFLKPLVDSTNAIILGNMTSNNNISETIDYTTYLTNFVKPIFDMSTGAVATFSTPDSNNALSTLQLVTAMDRLLQNKSPNDTLTVSDLQAIIRDSSIININATNPVAVKQQTHPLFSIPPKQKEDDGNVIVLKKAGQSKKSSKLVAFPQPSVLSNRALRFGAMVSSSFLGMIAGMSILPNLWLMGFIVGGIYGYDTSNRYASIYLSNDVTAINDVLNIFQRSIFALGRRIATTYLKLYDYWQGFFFMYKTGQLSYEYWKTYAALDDKFAIQQKIDAWNSRFVEGKIAFDQWEKENEVGRKVLATLRTLWLVEERSLKKHRSQMMGGRFKSKYRLVQLSYDLIFEMRRLFLLGMQSIRRGTGVMEVKEFVTGLYLGTNLETIRERISSSVSALIAITLVGLLFTISPWFVTLLAVIFGGIIWPSWVDEFYDRVCRFMAETRAKGRGERLPSSPQSLLKRSSDQRNRYHFFTTIDGSKRYYRVGLPWFGRKYPESKKKSVWWKWSSNEDNERPFFGFWL